MKLFPLSVRKWKERGDIKMFMYFFMLIIGILFIFGSLYYIVQMYMDREFSLIKIGRTSCALFLAILLLIITVPSLKFILLKEYDVVKEECVIEIDTSSRRAEATFQMLQSDEIFSFREIPELGAYGKKVPYSCKVTVTKDHMWEIAYEIYDVKTKKLLQTSE